MSEKKCKGEDTMRISSEIDAEGNRLFIRHLPDHTHQIGTLSQRPPEDSDSPVMLIPHEDREGVYHVAELPKGTGPAQVSTNAYRMGWDRIFGSKEVGVA